MPEQACDRFPKKLKAVIYWNDDSDTRHEVSLRKIEPIYEEKGDKICTERLKRNESGLRDSEQKDAL